MPILHAQFSGLVTNPQGQQIELDPKAALQHRGPVIQVTIALAQAFAQTLQQSGQTIPTPVSGWALLDTGASHTCIDDATAQAMALPVIDVATMTSASHVATQQNIYPITIEVTGVPIVIEAPRVMGAQLAPQGLILLIGRDVLQNCMLVYNGITGSITLSV